MKGLLIMISLICSYGESNSIENEDAVFAIFKLSYNIPGESNVVGGICGTAFLISGKYIFTANHVINSNTLTPNLGYKYCRFWLLKRGQIKLIIPFKEVSFVFCPDVETTIIILNKEITEKEKIKIGNIDFNIGDDIYSMGHVGGSMPDIKSEWIKNEIIINDYYNKN